MKLKKYNEMCMRHHLEKLEEEKKKLDLIDSCSLSRDIEESKCYL